MGKGNLNKKSLMLKLFFSILIITIIGLAFFLIYQKSSKNIINSSGNGTKQKIILTENGFSPETITIKKGATIEFSTTTGKFFWPASDIHPTHGIYSAFDPKKPISADKTWSFKFEEVGKWRCHDHLAPYFTCTITVTD